MSYNRFDDEILPQMQGQYQQPQPQQQQGLLDRIMGGIKDFTSDGDRMARMAIAANTMRYQPDQGLHAVMADRLKTSQAMKLIQAQANSTIEYLRSRGVPEEQIQAAASNPELLKEMASSLMIAERQKPAETFSRLTPEEVSAIPGLDPTKAYQKGSTTGRISQIGGSGTTINLGNLTESQGAATNFFGRASGANSIINDLEGQGTRLDQWAFDQIPVLGNVLMTPEFRRYNSAKNDFITAILRKESGAVIGVEEMANEDRKYFPQPGDDAQVIADKRERRMQALRGLEVQAGTGVNQLQKLNTLPQAPSATTEQQTDNPFKAEIIRRQSQ